MQQILPLADFRFTVTAYSEKAQSNRPDNQLIDLRHLPAAERETAARHLTTAEMHRPFNLSTGPLLRASLFRLGDTEHIFILTMHHIVSDGWSMGIFFRELGAFYDGFVNGRSTSLSPLQIQYGDFAHWQQQELSGNRLAQQLDYWRQQLHGAATLLELPTDWPRTAIQRFQGAGQTHWLPAGLSQALHGLSRQEGVTPFMILLTAFATLLHRYTRQDDILIGSPIANRTQAQTEPLIGFFVNTLVLRTDLSGQPTFRQLLQRVRETTLEAYAHQELPFEKLVEELRPERSLSHTPLFQVMFSLQNTPGEPLKLSGLTFHPIELDSQTTQFDLALYLTEQNGRFLADISYNTDLFAAATITNCSYKTPWPNPMPLSATCPCSLNRKSSSCKPGTTPPFLAPLRPSTTCLKPRPNVRPSRRPSMISTTASPTISLTSGPTNWPITCAAWASGPTPVWASAWNALWIC